MNPARLCRLASEIVQDIVSRSQDLFHLMKGVQLPKTTKDLPVEIAIASRKKVEDQIKSIRLLFRQLRFAVELCNRTTADVEQTPALNFIPYKDDANADESEVQNKSVGYKIISGEYKLLAYLAWNKNRHLKEIIEELRGIVWDINTMLAMKRTPLHDMKEDEF